MDIPGLLPSKVTGLSGIFITLSCWTVPVPAEASAPVEGLDVVVVVETAVIAILFVTLFPLPLLTGLAVPLALPLPLLFVVLLATPLPHVPLLLLMPFVALPLVVLQLLTAVTLTTPSLAMS